MCIYCCVAFDSKGSEQAMFKRGGFISRSFHSARGERINGAGTKLKRKFSWSSRGVRNAASEGVLTHRPVILKEGFLYKPSFFRFGGRKRRWCVLRTYTQTEASIDIYLDETKLRYKGTVTLDKEMMPMLIVKNWDSKKKSPKNCFLSLKVGKHTYQFTADSFRELKEWSSLIRQAMDNGHLFSGRVTEPNDLIDDIDDAMVNVKFNTNCIAILCPIKETPLKTWRLDHITSFGQCGGILTFECCSTCSDPSASRCSMNIIQEKPSTVLNIMERAIRNNPNTSEIHYERSILGDIYHCDHDCCQQRLLPAYSDPNLFRSASASPMKGIIVPIDLHEHELPLIGTLGSHDSGLPGTPQHADALSINSSIPSPTDSNKSSTKSPRHSGGVRKIRSISEVTRPYPYIVESLMDAATRASEDPTPSTRDYSGNGRISYSMVHPEITSPKRREKSNSSVLYTTVQFGDPSDDTVQQYRRSVNGRLHPVDEEFAIYDYPPDTTDSIFSPEHTGGMQIPRRTSAQSTSSIYVNGDDPREREEDFEELPPPLPNHNHRLKRPPVKELVKLQDTSVKSRAPRRRLHSASNVLDSPPSGMVAVSKPLRGSMDNLDQSGRNRNRSQSLANPFCDRQLKGSVDLLEKLSKQEEELRMIINESRRKRNDELEFNERHMLTSSGGKNYRAPPTDVIEDPDYDDAEEMSASLNGHRRNIYSSPTSIDKVMTKVASDTVRGYAYKITIPYSNSQYDVPRRAAPAPDLTNVRSDAPPKPLRHTAVE